MCPDGGTGRRAGLKIRFSQESGSSTLPLGTNDVDSLARILFGDLRLAYRSGTKRLMVSIGETRGIQCLD